MANHLDESRLVEVLEALYALERDDTQWLTQILFALSRVCGHEHHVGFFYDASDAADLKLHNLCRVQPAPPELSGLWSVFLTAATPRFVRATFRSLLVGTGRRSASQYVERILEERERQGHGDFFYLNGLDPSGLGCVLSFGSRERELVYDAREAALFKRIATHLSAAYRCRRRLAGARVAASSDSPDGTGHHAEAVVDGRGHVVHAEGAARSKAAREEIQRAAAAIESARVASRRGRGGLALEGWHPLVNARWTLVDSFEENGSRYVVARENQADAPNFSILTDRERQVVVHAALGLSNKEIAYTLGISATTVRVLMARAARRFGVRTRGELLAHSTLSAMRASVDPEP